MKFRLCLRYVVFSHVRLWHELFIKEKSKLHKALLA